MKKILISVCYFILTIFFGFSLFAFFANIKTTIIAISNNGNVVLPLLLYAIYFCLGMIVSILCFTLLTLFLLKRTNFLNFVRLSYDEYKTKKLESRKRKKQERIRKTETKLNKLKED